MIIQFYKFEELEVNKKKKKKKKKKKNQFQNKVTYL